MFYSFSPLSDVEKKKKKKKLQSTNTQTKKNIKKTHTIVFTLWSSGPFVTILVTAHALRAVRPLRTLQIPRPSFNKTRPNGHIATDAC